eukprot:gene8475-9171_t
MRFWTFLHLKINLPTLEFDLFLSKNLRSHEIPFSGSLGLKNSVVGLTGDESISSLAPTFSPTAFNPYKQLQTEGGGGNWTTTSSIILAVCLSFGIIVIVYALYRRCSKVEAYVLYGNADEFPSAECSTPRSQKSNETSEIVYAEEVFIETIDLDRVRSRQSPPTESSEIEADMCDVIELEQNVELV